MKTIWATLHVIESRCFSKREAQVILGRWVFILQYRRAAMGMLSKAWQVIDTRWPNPKQLRALKSELWMLVCLSPLLQADLRSTYDKCVTASDASEKGGAVAVSCDLTW